MSQVKKIRVYLFHGLLKNQKEFNKSLALELTIHQNIILNTRRFIQFPSRKKYRKHFGM